MYPNTANMIATCVADCQVLEWSRILIALRSHAKGHASCSTRLIQKRSSKRTRPLLGLQPSVAESVVFLAVGSAGW